MPVFCPYLRYKTLIDSTNDPYSSQAVLSAFLNSKLKSFSASSIKASIAAVTQPDKMVEGKIAKKR
jgi:hypothetical protein